MPSNELLVIALLLVPAVLMWGVFLIRSTRGTRRALMRSIPRALRPGQPDETLEGPRLERIQAGGLVATLLIALFIPIYWLGEPQRSAAFEERFNHEAVTRGKLIFSVAPPLDPNISPQKFKEEEKAISLGMGCAACHGASGNLPPSRLAGGGIVEDWTDPSSGKVVEYQVPPLQNVFQRWDEEIIRMTIERGRPGTPMPTWGVEYGGPMTDQMISDVIAWLKTLPGNRNPPPPLTKCENLTNKTQLQCGEQIFEARCAVCHGPKGQGKEEPGVYYSGLALWRGDVRHLNMAEHRRTIENGRRFYWMPQFSEAPAQGIPVPPNPLTEQQIRAVIAYERTL